MQDDDPDESPIHLVTGPFSAPTSYYTTILDRRERSDPSFEAASSSFYDAS